MTFHPFLSQPSANLTALRSQSWGSTLANPSKFFITLSPSWKHTRGLPGDESRFPVVPFPSGKHVG